MIVNICVTSNLMLRKEKSIRLSNLTFLWRRGKPHVLLVQNNAKALLEKPVLLLVNFFFSISQTIRRLESRNELFQESLRL